MRIALAALTSLALMAASPAAPDVYDGQPRFDQGDSYYLWRDGGTWHLRWVCTERGREFKGVVSTTGGNILSFQENNSEKENISYLSALRRISVSMDRNDPGMRLPEVPSANRALIQPEGPARLVFEARTTNSIGGFDFAIADSVTSITLDLLFDKRAATPNLIRLGKGMKKASAVPLVISLAPK